MKNLPIRQSTPEDTAAILTLYPAAFPEEDLLSLVTDLLNAPKQTTSLVAEMDGKIIAHAALTQCSIDSTNTAVALLGPIAVLPDLQKQGIGTSLIREGIEIMKTKGFAKVLVLGDPKYYSRFGFAEEKSIATPYPIPKEWGPAWQSITVSDEGDSIAGTLVVPSMWQKKSLWSE